MKKSRRFHWNWLSRFGRDNCRRIPGPRRIAFEPLESRCLLSAVGFSSVSNVTMKAGTTMFVPLITSDPAHPVSYAVSVSDYSKLTATLTPEENKNLELNINIGSTTQSIIFELFDTLSPETTAKIESLVNSGYYNGLQIYRNAKDGSDPFVIQGGNNPPSGSIKTSQANIAEEFSPELQFTSAGILAMARTSTPGTSSTEFFITEEATRFLDYSYTIFGFQLTGYDVISTIAAMENESSTSDYLATPLTITSASIFTDTHDGLLELRAPDGVTGTVTITVTASDGTNTPTTQTFTVTIEADASTNLDNPFESVIPAAPTSVTFVPPSGTSDSTTNLNNSTSARTLQFLVSGVASGNDVQILVDGTVIGQATANGTSVTVTTNGTTALLDGTHTITAIQVANDETVSVPEMNETNTRTNISKTADAASLSSPAVQLTIDGTAPTLTFTPSTVAIVGSLYSLQATSNDSAAVYQLDQCPSGMTIDADSGEISWTPQAGQTSPVEVTVRATDALGNYSQKTFSIDVLVANVPPVLTAANPSLGTTNEDTAAIIALVGTFINNGTGTTGISDSDDGAVLGGIALYATTGSGTWEYSLDGTSFTAISSVSTSSALLLNKDAVLRYTADGENGGTATISYRAWDASSGTAGGRFDLTGAAASSEDSPVSTASDTASLIVTDVNDAPVLTAANPILGSTSPDAPLTVSLTGTFITNGTGTTDIDDVDTGDLIGGIALVGTTGNGTWAYSLDGVTFTDVSDVSASAALLLPKSAKLRFTANAGNSGTATISYHAWDATSGAAGQQVDLSSASAVGGTTAFSIATDTASLSINSAPVLTAASPSLGTTDENTPVTISLTSTFINHGSGTTAITDSDTNNAVGGIALTGFSGHGTLAYSLDGTTFTDVGAISTTSALLLPADAELRYTPDSNNAETATITYRAWDATTGEEGAKVDTTTNGGASAFSSATDTASLTVTSINDAPVLTATSPALGSVVSTTSTTIALSAFINNGTGTTGVTDADTDATVGGIALIGLTGSGTWAYSLDGTTFTTVPTISESSALLLPSTAKLRYTPTSSKSATASISYRAWDTTSGTSGTTADTTSNGGVNAFSAATDTATLLINDAPVLTVASPSLGSTVLGTAITVKVAGTFINNGTGTTTITDADTNDAVGGIAITALTGSGTWAYSLDGTTFTSITSVSQSAALLLPSTASLRYTPTGTSAETPKITYRAWDATTGTAGGTADTTTNGTTTAFSSATDTASVTVAGGSISGYVYIDVDNDGLRTSSANGTHLGLPGVIVKLFSKDSQGNWVAAGTTMTASDGSYKFSNLAPGTYKVQEMQPSNYLDGQETIGKIAGVSTGTAGDDQFQLTLTAGAAGSEYNFGERGLKASAASLRFLVYPTMTASQIISQLDVAPAVYLSGSASASPYSTTYVTGGSATAITSSTATIADSDSPMLASMTVSLVNQPDGDSEVLSVDVSDTSVTSSYSGGVLRLTGVAELSVYRSLLAKITYSNTATLPTEGDRTIRVVVNDGIVDSAPAVATVAVASPSSIYSITADQTIINAAAATATSFTFTNAQIGSTYNYTVKSSGGTATLTGSGTITSVTQQIQNIDVSSLTDGTLTYSVTLTDAAGKTGVTATATTTLDRISPTGYTVTPTLDTVNASQETSTGFILGAAEIGATFTYTVTSSNGTGKVEGTGTVTSASQEVTGINVSSLLDGTLTYSVTLTDVAGNTGTSATATAKLDRVAPVAFTVTADKTLLNASSAANVTLTLTLPEAYSTYSYVVTSSGGSGSVTGSGTVLLDPTTITGISVASLPDGLLTFTVKLTDDAGNITTATTTATLDRAAPTGYSITASPEAVGPSTVTSAGFTFAGAEIGATYSYTITSSAGSASVTGTGTVSSSTQQVTGIDVSSLGDGTLTYTVKLTDPAGNVGSNVTATGSLDRVAPASYSITAGQSVINGNSASAASFTLHDAEVYTTCTYEITSSGGSGKVSGSTLVNSSTQTFGSINVSSLSDGVLTYNVTLIDAAGNSGPTVTATATLDRTAPTSYSVTANEIYINASQAAGVGFMISDAEVGSTYSYVITSDGGSGSVSGSGAIESATQEVTGIYVAGLADGTLTYSITLTDAAGNSGTPVTVTVTLDRQSPAGYTIAADQTEIGPDSATAASFTFAGAELGATYHYTVTSSGGGDSLTGSGMIDSADQQVIGIDVSGLPDGTLTYSVTLTDAADNVGVPATATAILDRVAPAGYTIVVDQDPIDSTAAASTSFTITGAEPDATYTCVVTSSGGEGSATKTGVITSANEVISGIDVSSLPGGTLTYTVTLTDPAGNVGASATATATLDRTVPAGYSIVVDQSQINAGDDATNTSFTFTGAELGATYSYVVTSSGGGDAVTGSGEIASPDQQVTGIDVSGLPDGTLTYSVTLTNAIGNTGAAATATAILDRLAPSGYAVTADQSEINAAQAAVTSFTFTDAELGTTYKYIVTSSGGDGSAEGSGDITSATQQIADIDVSTLPDGILTYTVTLTDAAGNVGTAVTATATLNRVAPTSYSIVVDQAQINADSATNTSFTFAGAELDATYSYIVTSSGGGASVTGTGTITSATQTIDGIDVSSLPDGTLTYSVTLTNALGNTGAATAATTTLDRLAPAGYSITADQATIDESQAAGVSLTIIGAEVGTTYVYTITSDGGSGSVTGSGEITSETQQVAGIYVAGLPDGTLTYSLTLTDEAGNTGTPATASATLDRAMIVIDSVFENQEDWLLP